MSNQPVVGIVMGSDSDWPVMRACAETLKKFGIAYEAKVLSAHRTPDAALDYASTAQERGMKIRESLAGLSLPITVAIYFCLLASIGFFGSTAVARGFIYAQF